MPKTSIKLFALLLLLIFSHVSYCFFFCAAAAEASAIEEVSSGEIDLKLGSSFMHLAWKNVRAVIIK